MSVPRETFDQLAHLRARHRVSASQLIAQAVLALLRGAIQVAPARSPYLLGLETYALRAAIASVEERAAWEARSAVGTCATCSDRVLVAPTSLEVGGPEYPICWDCCRPAEPRTRWKRARA